MIQQKQRFMENPRNYAVFKSKLTKDRDAATAEGNFDEADRSSLSKLFFVSKILIPRSGDFIGMSVCHKVKAKLMPFPC